MDIIDSKFKEAGQLIGLPEDQISMLVGLLLSVFYGWFFQAFIRGRQARIVAGLVFGLFLTYLVFREQILNILIQTIIVYVMIKLLGKKAPFPVFIESMLYLSAHHIYRQYYDYGGWKMDVSTILMMDTVKWTSFAMGVADGMVDESKLSKEQKQRKIPKLPSILDYFGYIFFFAGSLMGPAYDYYDFDIYVSEKYSIPNTVKEVARLFRNALICMAIYLSLDKYFHYSFVATPEFGNWNFLFQTLWFNFMIAIQRCKYYGGWQLGDMSISSCGLTYDNEAQNFEKIKSIELDWDLTYNMKDKVEKWNITIQTWLRRYVYCRICSEEEMKKSVAKQQFAYQTTYAVSAFWHGFYPGYYVSFFSWGILNNVNKAFYRAAVNTKYFTIFETNLIAKVLRWYICNTIFNVYGISFLLMSISPILKFYNNMYWIPHIILLGLYIFFIVTQFGQKKKKN